jgi:hypothetical protein
MGVIFISHKRPGKCGNCYAQATVSMLADRFSMLSLGYFKPILSPYEPTVCNGVINSQVHILATTDPLINNLAHSSAACTGNTLENIMEYIYSYGSQENSCFDLGILKTKGLNLEATISSPGELPYCSAVIGTQYDKCSDDNTFARFFRSICYYDVYPDIEHIKNEIFRWGPVATGMIIYDSFLNDYDGTTIYMGPKDKTDAEQGGHSVRIVGWGKDDNSGVDFWWVANSWGSWGILGYFRIKMETCDIEKNVMALIPDINSFPLDVLDYK